MHITTSDNVDKEAYDKVVDMLVQYNRSKTDYKKYINKPIEVLAKSESGEILGVIWSFNMGNIRS